mmetsp:Transcript_15953/g.49584  ORF Transcript_15953/g.49584 Transcript_15953/m.49584 type:complete len:276 (-) Transcript_15953:113-940(-)
MSALSGVLTKVAQAAFGLGVASQLAQSAVYIVDGGHRAVVFDRARGVLESVSGEGLNFVLPWWQTPHVFDIRTRPRSISSVTGTKDLQMVNITLRLLHKPDVEHLPMLYKKYGMDYDDRVLPSIANETLKAVVAQYNATELLTMRDNVSSRLNEELTTRANGFNIQVQDVAITHLSFGNEFTRAIEFKQVAQQDAERAKYVVEKAEQQKLAAVIRAEGESEAAKLISAATAAAGPGFIELRRIEAAKEVAATLTRSRNVSYLPQSGNMLFGLSGN